MKPFFKQLHTEAEQIRLSVSEKQSMRSSLHAAMGMPIASPYRISLFAPRIMMPLFLLLLVVGGGTAYAAQGSLPGNPLYAIKIHVNEPVQTALAFSPQAKAQINAQLAERRLQEAEILAQQGKLDATTTAQLKNNFDAHIAQASTFTQTLQQQDPAAATALTVQVNAAIIEHGAILTQLGDQSKNLQTKQDSAELDAHLQLLSDQTGTSTVATTTISIPSVSQNEYERHRMQKFSKEATSSNASSTLDTSARQTIAIQLEQQAADSLATVQEQMSTAQNALDTTSTIQLNAQLTLINTLMSNGSAALSTNQPNTAIMLFSQALHDLAALHVFLSAEHELRLNIMPPDSRGESDGGDNTILPSL